MQSGLVRIILSILLAVAVVLGLFMIMHKLIDADYVDPGVEVRKIADLVQPDEDIELETTTPKPDKVEDPEEPPPEMEVVQIEMDMDVDIENVAPKTQVEIAIDSAGMSSGDGEYLPIVKVAPIYPRRAQSRGITGYCIVEYTVTTSGAIRDPRPVDCQPSGVFDDASVKAAHKFKYKPRMIDGEAIEVPGVQNKFTYELED
jgi:protein TonB